MGKPKAPRRVADNEQRGPIRPRPVRPEQLLERSRGPALGVAHPRALTAVDIGPHELTGIGRRANDGFPPWERERTARSTVIRLHAAERSRRSVSDFRATDGKRRRS